MNGNEVLEQGLSADGMFEREGRLSVFLAAQLNEHWTAQKDFLSDSLKMFVHISQTRPKQIILT